MRRYKSDDRMIMYSKSSEAICVPDFILLLLRDPMELAVLPLASDLYFESNVHTYTSPKKHF
jgi:hypothetical protein